MPRKNFNNNSSANNFIQSLPEDTIETSDIKRRCKFNFSYFQDDQDAGQSFEDWSNTQGLHSLNTLLDKIKQYTREPLNYWKNRRVGGGGLKVLEYYGNFPANSDFQHPRAVPDDVHWARFRLGNKVRLVGFVIHPDCIRSLPDEEKSNYCTNTFYVVFLDKDHRFYKTEDE